MSPNTAGALLMMASMAAFVTNDTFLKLTGGTLPLFQLVFMRSIMGTILILIVARSLGPLRLYASTHDKWVIVLRSLAEVLTAYLFLNALFHMPLGNLTAIMQVVPLTVTLGSALIFREAVGWRRMLAIAVGLGGVLLIIRPGGDGFNVWSIYALGAVAGVTVRDLITRSLSHEVSGMTVTLGTMVCVLIATGLASLTEEWQPVSGESVKFIGGAAVFVSIGYFAGIQAMRRGDVAFNAPFRYTGLIAAMIIGFLVFDEVPKPLTFLGAGIVMTTGLFTFYRERKLSKSA
ncbi:S-adenosylmethionine uptake transporter [Sulfitobacter undariae]|uniref:S-adenosylmethionine uptake transporter n=1 Tax=Sulfitobacter undariae TaxID=1563671 RepID=A0A7W6GZ64_9RHOB|nr:DMT family transporter [Sulfitobacter undariae]MBB3993125.1 S-adenosylmethionine uptake transporter [Sulfitobacter undariae]